MDTDDIITQVISEVDRDDLTRAMVLQYLNNRQLELVNFDNWSFMEETAYTSTTDSQQAYLLPDDYKDELQLWLVDSGTNVKTPLVKWVGSEAEKNYANPSAEGKPFAYWVWQDAYFLYLIPDTIYTLWVKYYKYLTALTDTSTEENVLTQRYPHLMIAGAVSDAFHFFHQPDKESEWEAKYVNQFKILQHREGKRLHTNYNSMMKLRLK